MESACLRAGRSPEDARSSTSSAANAHVPKIVKMKFLANFAATGCETSTAAIFGFA